MRSRLGCIGSGIGFNTFEGTESGTDVYNETNESVQVENNDWGTEDVDEIDVRIDGPADYEPFLPKGTGMTAASLFCSVVQSGTAAPILDATVMLDTMKVTRNQEGVYAFPAVASGSYTLTITAPNHEPHTENIVLNENALSSITTPLKVVADIEGEGEPVEGESVEGESVEGEQQEGESEGEGETPPEKRCGCRRDETTKNRMPDARQSFTFRHCLSGAAGLSKK